MRKFCFYLVLFLMLITAAMALQVPAGNQNFKISYSKFVQVNDSLEINLISESESLNDYNFRWETNIGSIQSVGRKVIFYSPKFTGEAQIRLDIYYQEKLTNTFTINISVFRQLIILKADDLTYDKNKVISDNWTRFLHYVVTQRIKTSVGLIVNSLETDDDRFSGLLKYLNRTGYIELWIHGYDHRLGAKNQNGELYDEFRNSSLEFQKEQIKKAIDLSKQKLDFTMRTFGAPGNAIDVNTALALNAFDDIKVWFFGKENSKKIVLGRSADMEYPVGNPDYTSFVKNHDINNEYTVFQIHPNMWDENQFNEFKKIITYLKEEKLTFILPYEYYDINVTENIF